MTMITKVVLAIILLSPICATLAQTPTQPAPATSRVITDPMQIASASKLEVQPLSIEKLYLTHAIGQST